LRPVSVFMGTPEFAVPVLEALARVSELRLVVTQPDRPVGRGRRLESPPVRLAAAGLGIDVVQPERVKGRAFARQIAGVAPDVLVTAAYGRILGRRLLAIPRVVCLNVHASLLPQWRGAAPINWAIVNGESRSGVSIVRMVEALDAGPVYRFAGVDIGPDETAGELSARLARLGAETLVEVLGRLGELDPAPQDESRVSWAPMLKTRAGDAPLALRGYRLRGGAAQDPPGAGTLHRWGAGIAGCGPTPCARGARRGLRTGGATAAGAAAARQEAARLSAVPRRETSSRGYVVGGGWLGPYPPTRCALRRGFTSRRPGSRTRPCPCPWSR
jgi:folate-dependent phosphoribosylglycinamide formyltransferase PurN